MKTLCPFVCILIINIKIMITSSTHYYNIPTFIEENSIGVPITTKGYDPCRFFQIQNQTLYRMGESNIISSWNLNSLVYAQQNLYYTLDWSANISNVAIGQKSNQIAVTLLTPAPKKNFDILNPLTLLQSKSFLNTSTIPHYTIIKVQATQNQYLQLVYSNLSINYLNVYDKNMTYISQVNLNFSGLMNSTLSEDQSAIVIWNYQGKVRYVKKNGSSWVYYAYYNPYSNIQAMNSVAVSKNGTIVTLQYDSLSPFVIVDFSNVQVISQKNFIHTVINQVMFLDLNCHLIAVIVNYTTLNIYDILTLTLKSSTIFSSLSNYSAIDYTVGKLYFCLQQNIKVYTIQCPPLSYRKSSTNQCKNCSLSSNCIGCDQNTGLCNSCLSNFTLNTSNFHCQSISNTNQTQNNKSIHNQTNITNVQNDTINQNNETTNISNISNASNNATNQTISNSNNYTNSSNSSFSNNNSTITDNQQHSVRTLSQAEAQIANTTLQSFTVISPIITTIFTILQMSPFTLIFLSFMNYWNLCCLYSILDVKVPQYLPQIHQKIFQAVQTSIFSNLGFNPILPNLNNQSVPSNYYMINYQIIFDFINPNFQNALMIFFLLFLILATTCLKNFFLKKSSSLYKFLKINIVQSLLGQFISFVPFCILPCRFLINQTGYIFFSQKFNLILQVFLLILCLSAPCIFIWSRNQTYIQSKIKKSKSFKQISKNQIMSKKIIQKVKSRDKKKQNQNLKELQMFITNISVPLLILLPIYLPFFIVNLGIFLYGIKRVLKSTEYRINSIISACYLPLYHTCYIIFYFFGQNQFICHYVGLFCLVLLFLGGIHELCNVVLITLFQFLKWVIKTLKKKCRSSKIQDQSKTQNCKQNESPSISENIQKESIIVIKSNKVANNYNYQKKTFKKQVKNANISQSQTRQQKLKNKIKSIKFKTQRTYKGLEINNPIKPQQNEKYEKKDQKLTLKQKFTMFKSYKILSLSRKNIQKQESVQQLNSMSKNVTQRKTIQKINQAQNKDYVQRNMKSAKILPRYGVL